MASAKNKDQFIEAWEYHINELFGLTSSTSEVKKLDRIKNHIEGLKSIMNEIADEAFGDDHSVRELQAVNIYFDPVTCKDLEGRALVLAFDEKHPQGDDPNETFRALVELYDSEEGNVWRWINNVTH